MSPLPRRPATNRLLASLPARDRTSLFAEAEAVQLDAARVLCVIGQPIRHVYFPVDCLVSLLARVDARAGLAVDLVGNEGAIGLSILLGVDAAPLDAIVQGAGRALRIRPTALRRSLLASVALRRALNRYLYMSMAHFAQSAACAHFHLLEARLARWLVTTADRVQTDEFRLTHESLAARLGVRRVGVTTAAVALQRRGLIRYRRGLITIVDRAGLEAAACVCYRAEQDLYDRIA